MKRVAQIGGLVHKGVSALFRLGSQVVNATSGESRRPNPTRSRNPMNHQTKSGSGAYKTIEAMKDRLRQIEHLIPKINTPLLTCTKIDSNAMLVLSYDPIGLDPF